MIDGGTDWDDADAGTGLASTDQVCVRTAVINGQTVPALLHRPLGVSLVQLTATIHDLPTPRGRMDVPAVRLVLVSGRTGSVRPSNRHSRWGAARPSDLFSPQVQQLTRLRRVGVRISEDSQLIVVKLCQRYDGLRACTG